MESNAPMYVRLLEELRGKIERGEYPAGHPIPSERELAGLHGLNRMTVRSAVSQLVTEGILRRAQGKGTFVMSPESPIGLPKEQGFSRVMKSPSANLTGHVLLTESRPATVKLARLFELKPDERVFFCQKLFSASGVPVELEETYLPIRYAPGIELLDLAVYSPDEAFAHNGFTVTHLSQALRLVRVEDARANLLEQGPQNAVFLLECVGRGKDGVPLKFTRTYTRGDLCSYATILRRSGAVL